MILIITCQHIFIQKIDLKCNGVRYDSYNYMSTHIHVYMYMVTNIVRIREIKYDPGKSSKSATQHKIMHSEYIRNNCISVYQI